MSTSVTMKDTSELTNVEIFVILAQDSGLQCFFTVTIDLSLVHEAQLIPKGRGQIYPILVQMQMTSFTQLNPTPGAHIVETVENLTVPPSLEHDSCIKVPLIPIGRMDQLFWGTGHWCCPAIVGDTCNLSDLEKL